MKSTFMSLNANDLIKGAIMAMLTAIATALIPVFESGALPTFEVIKQAFFSGLGVGVLYLLKNLVTNSEDKILKKESQA